MTEDAHPSRAAPNPNRAATIRKRFPTSHKRVILLGACGCPILVTARVGDGFLGARAPSRHKSPLGATGGSSTSGVSEHITASHQRDPIAIPTAESQRGDSARPLLVATTNRGKLREVAEMLNDFPVSLLSLADFPPVPAPEENRETFEGNADLKALYYASACDCWTLADDSGLEVDALHGAPGVHSAYYAGEPRSDAANNAKLIHELQGTPLERRTARFRCALVLARPGIVLLTASGIVEGVILDEPRGSNGFGYDPHFLISAVNRTAAELAPDEKNRVSHRGHALTSLKPALIRLLAEIGTT